MPLRLVNVIPAMLSGETRQDSECSVTVNPANPDQIALAAFTVDPASSGSAPIFVSTDGGAIWTLNVCVPGGNRTNDISVRFGGTTGILYAAILRQDNGNFNLLRSSTFPPVGPMTILVDRDGPDQPWTEAGWHAEPDGTTVDRVFVTAKDSGAVVQFSVDAATGEPPAGFADAVPIEARAGSTSPSVRTSVHRRGVIYGVFVGTRDAGADIVVVRDDDWGAGGWTDLVDEDGIAGKRVVSGAPVPRAGTTKLGSVRVSSRLSIAADPLDWQRVYVAWCDGAATPESPFRLHLRRSDDAGVTWTEDLRSIDAVTNPALAVNMRGSAALMYQRLTRRAGADRWETHLEISDDRFETVRTDMTVADVPDLGGTFQPIIGDYANLIAVGKEFHGAFCGFNVPDPAHFPNGVVYLRNVDWPTRRLLHPDGVSEVGASVDPFYVRYSDVEPEQDFYVRDWTGDNGVEPSTHPVFWAESDVWNRGAASAGPARAGEPAHALPRNGSGEAGENRMFAAIRRRRRADEGTTTVSARFLRTSVGVGSNYLDVSSDDPVVAFDSADVGPLPVHAPWRLEAAASSHQCLAVEISTAADPAHGPSLRGRAPGWPDCDNDIVDDNNRALRNMAVVVAPSRGVTSSQSSVFGVVHNAATRPRDIVLDYALAFDRPPLGAVSLRIMRERRRRAKSRGQITLPAMQPGENRWVGITFRPPPGRVGDLAIVHLMEVEDGAAVSGFGLGARLGTLADAVTYTIERHRSVFTRMLEGWQVAAAEPEVQAAVAALRDAPTPARWIGGIARRWDTIEGWVGDVAGEADSRSIAREIKATRDAIAAGRSADALVALDSLLEHLDVSLTIAQLEAGDRADIAQTVRWQAELLPRLGDAPAIAELAEASRTFVDDYAARRSDDDDYAPLLRAALPMLRRLEPRADRAALLNLERALDANDPAMLQCAHRQVLLRLDTAP